MSGGNKQSGGANERRLKPIFDLVDDGNYKQAVASVDKVLKKTPNFTQAKALKALSLWRCGGRNQEAVLLVEHIVSLEPDDEASLGLLSLCLRDMHREETVAELYSKAVTKHPKDEELLCSLFMAHVRLSDFKQQQLRAVQLNKAAPNKPYYFWAVMSLVLQAKADPVMGVKMHLPLARKMLEKSIQEGATTKTEQMELLLMVLEEQSDWVEALQILKTHSAVFEREIPAMREKRKIEYLLRVEDHEKIRSICIDIISTTIDEADWIFFQTLVSSTFALSKSKLLNGSDEADKTDESDVLLTDTINFLLSKREEHVDSIGHNFSLLYLKNELIKSKISNSNIASLTELIVQFFHTFGRKSCFFSYVRHCLPNIEQNLCELMEKVEEPPEESPTLHGLYRLQSLYELKRYFEGQSTDVDLSLKTCNSLRQLYEKYLPLGSELKPTEPQFANKFMLIAVHYLLDCYMASNGEQKYLWLAVEHLEAARVKSPHDSQILLGLLRLYDHMGLFQPCTILYDQMQIKQFLHHSMGYVISTNLHHFGAFDEANALFDSILKYFTTSVNSIPDYVVSSFRNGSFRQIMPLLAWKESLSKSFAFHKCVTEKLFLSCLHETGNKRAGVIAQLDQLVEIIDDCETPNCDDLEDHRDMDILFHWEPEERSWNSDEAKKTSFHAESQWLKIRTYAIRAFVSLLKLLKPEEITGIDNVANLASTKLYFEKYETSSTEIRPLIVSEDWKIVHPFSHPVNPQSLFFMMDSDKIMSQLLQSVIEIYCSLGSISNDSKLTTQLNAAAELIRKSCSTIEPVIFAEGDVSQINPRVFLKLELILECYGLAAFSMDIVEQMMFKSKLFDNRKVIQQCLTEMQTTCQLFVEIGQEVLVKVEAVENNLKVNSERVFLNQMTMVNQLIIQSYQSSVDQIKRLTHKKIQYFKSFKF